MRHGRTWSIGNKGHSGVTAESTYGSAGPCVPGLVTSTGERRWVRYARRKR